MMDYQQLIKETALADDRYIVMTAENRAVIRELPPLLGGRFIDTGITEQCMIGTAAGLALRGRIPICHALTTFLILRAYEFIRTDVGIANLPVKLSGFIPGVLSDGNGPTHQALEDISLMRGVPHMEVFAPADHQDMVEMLPHVWSSSAPSYVRLNTRFTDYKHEPFTPGKAEVIGLGTDVTLLVYGFLFEQALIAKQLLEGHGLSVGMINLRTLKPLDETAVLDALNDSTLTVTIEDHFQTGGLYSIVAEVLLRHQRSANVLPIAFNERWFRPALLDEVLSYEQMTGEAICQRTLDHLEKTK
ncbi:MAG: transketolase C-terminal domain-containing protein [Bacteroidota bacterium]